MLRKVFSLITLIFFFASLFAALNAQETSEQAQQNLLPEIDPQDIEIRSQFQARFPGLRRQPILGFNPKPRVFQVDPNRTPFIESEEAIAASLPVGELDRPDAPGYTPLSYSNPQTGFARLGLGSFVTPEADVYLIRGLGEKNWVSGNLSHRSSNGHIDEYNTSFRNFEATVRSRFQFTSKAQLRLNAGTFSDFNYHPPVELGNQVEGTAPDFGPGLQNVARSSNGGIHFGGDFKYDRNSVSGLTSEFNLFSNQFEIENSAQNTFTNPGSASEWGGNATIKYSWTGQRVEEIYSIFAQTTGGSIDLIEMDGQSWNITHAGARYDRLLDYQTDIDASFGGAVVSDAFHGSKFYITPVLDIRHTLFDGLDLRGRLAGEPTHNTYRQYRQQNRFIGLTEPVSHQYTTDLRGEVILEPLSGTMLTGGIQFQHIRNFNYFTRRESSFITSSNPPSEITVRSDFQPNFENATFFKLYGSFSQQLSAEKFWVSADAYWQRPRLSGNEKIPFVESIGVKGTASYRPIQDLVFEGWVDFSGSRHNPVDDDLNSYFLLGARFELSLSNNAGIYAKLLNINDVNYEIWQGYEERGFQAYLGITYLF